MLDVLLRALSFAFIIVVGIVLRLANIVDESAGAIAKKILMFVTLPASIIIGFSSIDRTVVGMQTMLLLVVLGIGTCVVMIAVGAILTRRSAKKEQVLFMMCLPSYNIGAFCVPFIGGFIGAAGQAIAYMFDVGNSIMCNGGTYAFVSDYTAENKEKKGIDIKSILKKLFTSPAFTTYILMFIIVFTGIRLPERLLTFITPIKEANAFVAMLMLGLLFKIELKRSYISKVALILIIRLLFAIVFALLFYFVLPFDLFVRQALVLVSFGPLSAVAPAYIGMCNGDEGLASCANSISIIISLIIMTSLVAFMGLSLA